MSRFLTGTLPVQARNNFPFRKQCSKIDVDLADGTGDEEYLEALAADRLGRLSLTAEGMRQRDRMVMENCRRHGVPLAVTPGGGYAEPIRITAEAHANTFRTAALVITGERI